MLDTVRAVNTPEGVTVELPLAGPGPRALAWLIDFGIRLAVYITFINVAIASQLAILGGPVLILLGFLLEWIYPVLFEVFWRGATPGKRLLGLAVVRDDGVPVGWAPATVRNLLRVADFLPVPYGLGVLSMLLHPEFRRLGDLAAGTVVVHVRPVETRLAVAAAVPARPLTVPLDRAEQQALMVFAARVPRLTPARSAELAGLLAGTALAPDGQVEELLACARALTGEA